LVCQTRNQEIEQKQKRTRKDGQGNNKCKQKSCPFTRRERTKKEAKERGEDQAWGRRKKEYEGWNSRWKVNSSNFQIKVGINQFNMKVDE